MASDKKSSNRELSAKQGKASAEGAETPGWADGLKQLYDSVVEEPLPDSFLDLLDQFDENSSSDADPNDDLPEKRG